MKSSVTHIQEECAYTIEFDVWENGQVICAVSNSKTEEILACMSMPSSKAKFLASALLKAIAITEGGD